MGSARTAPLPPATQEQLASAVGNGDDEGITLVTGDGEPISAPRKGGWPKGKPRKPATVNRELACLSRICSMAVDNGLLGTNPCNKVKRRRENNARTRYLTSAEEKQLMAAITSDYEPLRPIIIVALNTGMPAPEDSQAGG